MGAILIPVLVLGGLGLFLGGFLAYSAKKFEVKMDPNVEKVFEALPGANCGACGYPGCSGYAEAVAGGKAEINLCAPGGGAVVEKISEIMGLNADIDEEKKVARVMCHGDNSKTTKKFEYDVTLKSCAASNLYYIGDKSCTYGCLGYGDCVAVCPFDAIHINDKGIAEVDEEKCTACGKCVIECPKHIINIVPEKSRHTVFCSSKDKGADSRKVCDVSCIGCGICAKNCPVNAITVENNLAKIDPEICINCGICELKCPTNAIKSDIKEIKKAHIEEEKCVGCTMCAKVCPVDAIEGELKHKHKIIEEKCVGCGACVEKCPTKAITLNTVVEKN
ncbi:RnfABCDGE type electron transport complex subunit B [Haliovirga abyssi]|uniref:Ion-translocating oxidoreductase complex subunit B n=1 Tax=Haliovirga abyssi TaxID=2996794 RepID=A0AAU9DWQ5_9FUSO|nr:Fe-S cluster domain-containing protein [Haliovirga abyssi]BDU49700.1 electron transport complex protein RnfB [Haliovirga abyssi]